MPRTVEGHLSAAGLRVAIVVSRFNDFVTGRMLEGALDAIRRSGGDLDAVTVYKVPGAFEIPAAARRVCRLGGADAVVCLGAVIRGATRHNEYISSAVIRGIADVQAEADIPVAYGVITPDTIEQAIERAGTKAGNKGFEAAMAAIEMCDLFRRMEAGDAGGEAVAEVEVVEV